jgi:hypothetical protein
MITRTGEDTLWKPGEGYGSMKYNKEAVIQTHLIYRNVFVFNESQWCGYMRRYGKNIKRRVVDDWKRLYCATGVPVEVPEWNWGRGDV